MILMQGCSSKNHYERIINTKDEEIAELKQKLENCVSDNTCKDLYERIINIKDEEIAELKQKLENCVSDNTCKDLYEGIISIKDGEIAELKQKLKNSAGDKTSVCAEETDAVDLGLSVKWASMNVGAKKPTDMGTHFSWAETTPVDEKYDYMGYSNPDMVRAGVLNNDYMITAEHDAATVNKGACWRMPTGTEACELYDNCRWEYTEIDGVPGAKVTGPNGNSIFLPAVGVKKGGSVTDHVSLGDGYYWTRSFSPVKSDCAKSFVVFRDGRHVIHQNHTRYDGVVIRPVLNK
ncbi:MAG: hypothetical protein PUC42_04200 [Bacteroidales bacterium]|nr:hypothetical protein [Bacteroidales bacterium]